MKHYRKIAVVLTLLLAINVIFASLDDEIAKNEEARRQLQEDLKGIHSQKVEIDAQLSAVERQVQTLNGEIEALDETVSQLSNKIDETETAISNKQRELEEALVKEAEQNERMKHRLRTMYKAGSFSYLEIILGADDFSEMMTHLDKIQMLLNYDEQTLAELIAIRQFIADTKQQLQSAKAMLVQIRQEEADKLAELEVKHADLQQKQAELQKEEQALINIENQAIADANAITAVLKKQYADKRAQELAAQYKGGIMMWPLPSQYYRISSDFGMRMHPILRRRKLHSGIDLPAPSGTSIYAASDGVVIHSGWMRGYGKVIMLDHGGGIITLYAHCSSLVVQLDQVVERGQVIAKVGSTGRSTGPHLHFEVRKAGDYVDPKPYLKKQ